MSVFTAGEIIDFAERIHENGANFYQYAIQLVQNQEAKELFGELADEERSHQKEIARIFAGMEKSIPPETYEGEYAQYLRNYIDNNVTFTKEAMDKGLAQVKDACSAIDFALQMKQDSINYYQSVKDLVPKMQHDLIDKLIVEERNHFVKLANLRKCVI
ncbi:MAG TPA: ferritin family protein [Smithellaceae bacterium]|jgi:rubrerythrin|nr:ferritin family protein [Smithellaceae bacterium]HQF85138.1 ferritin family protein [Smithellaceae bacterium]HQG80858.1 ferritin family protein [Smithellaceae bacterium]